MQVQQFKHYEEIVGRECHGVDLNNTQYENDVHDYCYSLFK